MTHRDPRVSEPRTTSGEPLLQSRPSRDMDVWETLAHWREARRRFVLATVTGSRGFTPRKAGAHMLIAESGETCGTIGGGAIEHDVRLAAAALLARPEPESEPGPPPAGAAPDASSVRGATHLVERHLTQELGMCCGGAMSVFLEVIQPAPALLVFGAGYIAKPLAAIAAGCGFDVTVFDARPDWASPERFPTARLRLEAPEDAARALQATGGEFAVVVTHDHALDQRLVQELLARPLRFVGMIGSLAKQRKFALRLKARGFTDAQIARLRTPLGVSIGAQTPEEIAVSVVAELIAVRRGRTSPSSWVPTARAAREEKSEP